MIGVGNFHINTSNVWSFFSAAAKNGGYAVDVINACFKAGLDAAKDRDNVREAIDKELAKWTDAPGDRSAVVEIAWRVVDVLEDHLEEARAQMMTILFVNNTPFNTYTSAQPEYQQTVHAARRRPLRARRGHVVENIICADRLHLHVHQQTVYGRRTGRSILGADAESERRSRDRRIECRLPIMTAMAIPPADPMLTPIRSRISCSACCLPSTFPATAIAIRSTGAMEKTMAKASAAPKRGRARLRVAVADHAPA